jgi:release factor glutamine methyltransferase
MLIGTLQDHRHQPPEDPVTATVGTVLQAAARRLLAAGIDTARLDARLLLSAVLKLEAPALIAHPDRQLSAAERERFLNLLERRCRRQPLAQLLGRREFWGLSFRVTADTLDPRPDSETVIEAALAGIADRTAPLEILDLGTGTGCLLLALLHDLPRAAGIGIDCSEPALAVARANAADLGLADRARFRHGHWGDGLAGSFDFVVGNPPYVSSAEIERLMPEVSRHEPRLALDGGPDGLDAYRAIAGQISALLRPQGRLVLEVGADQSDSVAALFAAAGLACVAVHRDLSDRPRALVLQWNC